MRSCAHSNHTVLFSAVGSRDNGVWNTMMKRLRGSMSTAIPTCPTRECIWRDQNDPGTFQCQIGEYEVTQVNVGMNGDADDGVEEKAKTSDSEEPEDAFQDLRTFWRGNTANAVLCEGVYLCFQRTWAGRREKRSQTSRHQLSSSQTWADPIKYPGSR
ncbi:hypothetical protein ABKN59_002575 [Abortiporus biennis]